MPRKTTKRKPPVGKAVHAKDEATKIPPPPVDEAPADPTKPPKRKRGRPSKEQKKAEQEAARAAAAINPAQLVPATSAFLHLLAVVIKGDSPTKDEVIVVNVALTTVVNKYATEMRWAEEIMLVLAVGSVGISMKKRAQDKRAEESKGDARKTVRSGDRGSEGLREVGDGQGVSGLASP